MKIITALTNEILNEKLRKTGRHEIICKDIQYQEALLEILDKNVEIELLILSNILPGELNIYELINIIKYKKENIKIFIILDEQKDNLIKFLIKKGITDIFINNEISIEDLIEKIENKQEKIVEQNNEKAIYNKEKIKTKVELFLSKCKIKKKTINKKEQQISIIGAPKVGKSIFMILLSLSINYNKILLISFEKNDLNIILGKKKKTEIQKYNENIDLLNLFEYKEINKYELKEYDYIFCEIEDIEKGKEIIEKTDKIILLVEPNLIGLKETSTILEKVIKKMKINKEKVEIVYNKVNIFSINKQILNQLFSDFKILGSIKNNVYYNFFINKNCKVENLKIRKEYKKIIKTFEDIKGENKYE